MILDACEAVQNACGTNATLICRFIMKLLGPALVAGYYWLLGYHTWVFLTIIAPVLRKRVGAEFATLWTIIGIIITFNQVWNHVLAMCLKPGSPKDLIRIEKLRKQLKNKENRTEWESGRSSQPQGMLNNSERLEGVSRQVKAVMKYRHKTVDDLKRVWKKTCTTCNEIKPARTSHCKMCD